MKSGIKSSEFYMSLAALVTGLLVMGGYLVPERQTEVTELVSQAIGGAVALFSLINYTLSRTELKKSFSKEQSSTPVQG